jgi:hypothetical protein
MRNAPGAGEVTSSTPTTDALGLLLRNALACASALCERLPMYSAANVRWPLLAQTTVTP